MRPVFADTSYYIALFHEDDLRHAKALRFSQDRTCPVVLTDFILLELGNALCRGQARNIFINVVANLRSDPLFTIIPVSAALFEAGLQLFGQRLDKEWSLTDCISFIVMKRHRLTEALTADHHFEQAGFKALLK
jgi:uncharacterized protein